MRCSTGQLRKRNSYGGKMVNGRPLSRRWAGFSHGFDGGPMCLHKARGFVAVSWRDGEEHHGPDMFDLEVFQLHLDLVAHDNSVRCGSVSYDPQS